MATKKEIQLQQAYANLYNEIVQPDRVFVASQYFRQKWLPLLGHALAWLILAWRQRCYWNKRTGEVRNTCVVTQEELAGDRADGSQYPAPAANYLCFLVRPRRNQTVSLRRNPGQNGTPQVSLSSPDGRPFDA